MITDAPTECPLVRRNRRR